MQQRLESSREDSTETKEITTSEADDAAAQIFAEVAVPVHVSSTFTYRLPASMRDLAQAGSRIVVPFGRKFVTGYITEVSADLATETRLQEADIKEARELLDVTPLVTPQLLELTRWVSEYYLAPWGEVIKAALPPGISPIIERFLSITPKGRAELAESASNNAEAVRQQLLQSLGESGEIALPAISNQFGSSQATRLMRELERDGLTETLQRPAREFVRAKYQRRVRLVQPIDSSLVGPVAGEGRKLTAGQERIVEALRAQKSLSFPSCCLWRMWAVPRLTLCRNGRFSKFSQRDNAEIRSVTPGLSSRKTTF